ncbi:MAG: xcpT 9 [Planctomycetaceae bacterium]|nr:xcpT 9 [Planctomycetaceae bacterium]
MRSHKTRRSGFTLVELVAVAGAVSLMGTQIFDAILQAREASNRSQCKNNLKQIGLALHNYHDTFVKLPPGWIGGDANPKQPNVFGLNGWGWQAMITPFVDQAPLYNKINFNASVADPANAAAVGKTFPILRCPSDPFNKKTWTIKDADGKDIAPVATANYVASFGTSDFSKCEKMKPGEVCEGDGLFYHNSALGFRDIKDGLSNTLAVGERSTSEKMNRMTTWSGVFPTAKSPFARILGTSDQALDAKEKNASGYGSAHKGISQFLIMDGSIRVLKTDTDLKVFQALTTRAGGEEIPQE